MHSKKQFEVLKWASSYLEEMEREVGIAEILLQHHLNISRTTFFMDMQQVLPEETIKRFKHDIKQHALHGVPVQHLTGYADFYGRTFKVNEHVLVPRFDTEELVQSVIELVDHKYKDKPLTIVDIGTGSGVIGITLALELPNACVYATDISTEALQVAKENAQLLHAKVNFLQGDFLKPVITDKISPQIIVSNPPYIKQTAAVTLTDTVIDYDPHLALFGGEDGLEAYRQIIKQLKDLPVEEERSVLFEIGFDQAAEVVQLARSNFPESSVQTKQDLTGNDRIVSVTL